MVALHQSDWSRATLLQSAPARNPDDTFTGGGIRGGALTSPRRCAHSAALVRSVTPIWVKTLVRCAFTVRSAMPRVRAICLLASPSATSTSTSFSRPDSTDTGAGRARPASRTRAARGSSGDSPRAAARTAPTSPSGSASLSRYPIAPASSASITRSGRRRR